MAKSGGFEVADSSCRLQRNAPFLNRMDHFLENRPFMSTLCTLKVGGWSQFQGIGQSSSRNKQEESVTSKLPLLAI